jgi:hypothetical protein
VTAKDFGAPRLAGALVTAVLAVVLFPAAAAAAGNLLAGKSPTQDRGVRVAQALTDGRAAPEGDFWNSDATAIFQNPSAFVVYDLGSPAGLVAAWLQGDNNDSYKIEVSADGAAWQTAWTGGPVPEPGLRARYVNDLHASGRYVRISASGGDGAYGLSEVQLFSEVPQEFPPKLKVKRGVPLEQKVRDRALIFGLALITAVLLAFRGAPLLWTGLLLAWPLWAGVSFALAVFEAAPVETRTVSLVRAVLGLVAAVAVLRECFPPVRFPAHRKVALAVLSVCAALSFLAFYNLGQPQFYDNRSKSWTFAHYLDLRQYYPTAKYFKELGYRDMYVADVAAYREEGGASRAETERLPMRDLDTLGMSTVAEQEAQIDRIKSRFKPERWEAYKRDARYFRESMGTPHYLETMFDMGGNATPVWMSLAYIMFNALDPSNEAFLFTGALDPLLLLFTFFMIGRSFGVRTALVSMVVFGANDFIMYGTNWGGATLRHDWLAYLGLAACAMRSGRFLLGGVLLGCSTMIRAFPGLTFVAVSVPALWKIGEYVYLHRALPSWQSLYEQHRPTIRIIIGGVAAMAVLFLFSAAVLPVRAWGDWLHKVAQLSSDPHPSHLSLRSLIAGWEGNQASVLRQRLPVFIAGIAFVVGLVVVAARGRRPEQAALLGLPLIPTLLYPGNYYLHFVFLLPMLVAERDPKEATAPGAAPLGGTAAGVWTILLLMCFVQYGTALVLPNLPLHFYLDSAILYAALVGILLFLARERVLAAGWWQRATS